MAPILDATVRIRSQEIQRQTTHGSPFSPNSINNSFGLSGSPYSFQSPTNPYTVTAHIQGLRRRNRNAVQKQLRHTRPDTTLMEYCKEIPDAVYTMTDSMYDQMTGPAAPAVDLAQMPAKGGDTVTGPRAGRLPIDHILNTVLEWGPGSD